MITGSRLLKASIWPERIAATAPLPAPTPTMLTSLGLRPTLASAKLTITLVDEPGAVTPIFLPLRSATPLKLGMVLGLTPSTICGARPCSTKARRRWPLCCMLTVCSKAPLTTSALPPDHRPQGLRAAGEVDDGQVQPFGLEVAALLGDGQRQVVQQVLAAHGQRDLGFVQGLGVQQGGGGQPGGGGGDQGAAAHEHLHRESATLACGQQA